MIPVISTHAPAGASLNQLIHFGQLIRNPRFLQFDYGFHRNFFIYNRSTPPEYKLKRCTTRVAIIYSEQDSLSPAKDVRRLPKELPNVVAIHRVEDETFNHIDFVWGGMDAKHLVYDIIVDWLKAEDQRQHHNATQQ